MVTHAAIFAVVLLATDVGEDGYGGKIADYLSWGRPLPLALCFRAVRDDVSITKEQLEALRGLPATESGTSAAESGALARLLRPDQVERLYQVSRQVRGGLAVFDSEVEQRLKLSDDQRGRLKTEREAIEERISPILMQALSKLSFRTEAGRRAYVLKELRKSFGPMLNLLSPLQKKQLSLMNGKPFDVDLLAE